MGNRKWASVNLPECVLNTDRDAHSMSRYLEIRLKCIKYMPCSHLFEHKKFTQRMGFLISDGKESGHGAPPFVGSYPRKIRHSMPNIAWSEEAYGTRRSDFQRRTCRTKYYTFSVWGAGSQTHCTKQRGAVGGREPSPGISPR